MIIPSSESNSQKSDDIRKIHRYSLIGAALWTFVIFGLYFAYVIDNRNAIFDIGRNMALVAFEKDILFRRWAARHGGVYAPVTAETPVNPYLKNVPERDITTPSGKLLTLINPAYMSRQIFDLAQEKPDIPQGHITSLNPIRPENVPDAWETQALKKMELGAQEVVETIELNGQPHLRLMRLLVTEKPCLRCHAEQGYKEGDSRGGISVTLSLAQIHKAMNLEMLQEALIHSFIWLLGLGFLWYGTKRITKNTQSLRDERNNLLESELRFRSLADTAPVMIWIADHTKGCTYFNKVWCDFTGREHHELIGNGWASDVHPDDLDRCIQIYESSFDSRQPFTMEYRLRRHDGEYLWMLDNGVPRWMGETNFIGYIGSCIDISEHKWSEFIMKARIELSEYSLKHSMDELLTKAIDMIEVLTSSSIGFFHFIGDDQKTLELQAWSSNTLSTMCSAKGKFEHYSVDVAGVWVECVHQRRPVIHNDYATLPNRKGMPDGHAPVVRELVVPIFRGDQIVAILGVGNKICNYTEQDINAVSQMANLAWDIVIAKRSESALRKSEELLRSSQRMAKIGGWEWDVVHQRASWTEEAYNIHDIKPDEIKLGSKGHIEISLNCYNPEDREDLRNAFICCSEKGVSYDLELPFTTVLGREIWVRTSAQAIYNGAQIVKVVGNIMDITDRKNAVETLRENESRQAKMLANIGDVIVVIDQDGINRYKSPNVEKWFGWKPEELVGKNTLENVHPEDQDLSQKFIASLQCQPGAIGTTEVRYRCKEGSYKWIEITLVNLLNDPEIQGYLGNYRDISERKKIYSELHISEEQSRNSAQLLQRVIEHFPGVIFWKDTESVYLGCNKNFSSGAGLNNPEEVVGKTDFDLPWAETEAAKYRADDRTVIESGESKLHIIETQYQADNQIAWFDTCKVALYDQQNKICGVLGASFDITAVKKADEERHLLQQQLYHAQKLESLGVLAGGIAHDFNNILTIILGHCFIAREVTYSEQEYKAFFQQIETAGYRAADLCRQMLTYAGKSPLAKTQVNLWLLVDEVVKMLRSGLKKNVSIELDIKRVVPEIQGDAGQLQQIVMNLIINAAEAIGDNNGIIKVALTRLLVEANHSETDVFGTVIKAGGYICLEVTDSGCGMDKETQKKIFEPFYTTKFTGRGLGMSAVKGIITSHEALLYLNSTPGAGTSFKVYFPIQEAYVDAEIASTESTPSGKNTGTVLLVDDEQILRDMGVNLLEVLCFKSFTASNGQEALEIYRDHRGEIDLILLDFVMPVMGGIEAYHELRKLNSTIPIIICSGYSAESIDDIISSDLNARAVTKPFNPGKLRDVMVAMISTERF